MKKKALAILLAAMMLLSVCPISALAADTQPVDPTTVSVDFTSQMNGAFLHAPQFGVEISSDLAESYGYTDDVDGVSVLDVLVRAHELVYGEDFTAETAEDYLTVSRNSPTMQFGVAPQQDYTMYGGFFYNHCMANDGTMYDQNNYNGTLVGTQEVKDGDLVEFFFYESAYMGDSYTWFLDQNEAYSRSFRLFTGDELELNLKYFYAMSASIFANADEMVNSPKAFDMEDAQICIVDPETGALTEIEDAVTDEDGFVTLSFDEPGTYLITATNDDEFSPAILTLTSVKVLSPTTVAVDFTSQLNQAFLHAPQFGAEVSSDLAESYGYTDAVDGVSVLDVLVRAHELVYGEDFTPESAEDYLTMAWNSPTMQFGIAPQQDYTMYGGFFYNHCMANDGTMYDHNNYNGTLVGTQEVKDGDLVEFFFYESAYMGDSYTWFLDENEDYARSFEVAIGNELELNLKSFYAMSASIFANEQEMVHFERASDMADAQICLVDSETGALTEIEDAVTDEDGFVTLSFDDPGTYLITASNDDEYFPAILTLTSIVVTEPTDAKITVPEDAELFVGSKTKHFVPFDEILPSATRADTQAGTVTYYYDLANNKVYNYRVSGEDYVTYAGTFTKKADFALEITEAMLQPDGVTPSSVDHDVSSNNGYNVADVFLNINPQGYLKLAAGDTYQLVHLRNWEAVNSVTGNYFIEPDYHYTVIDESGSVSNDVIAVSDSGLISALGDGTAIVLVTYDAFNFNGAAGGPLFGAIWPENTGVFVVSVGAAEESGIVTGMTVNEGLNTDATAQKMALDAIDAELDVIYFTGNAGSYSFTPGTEGCSVSVANPTVGETLSFTGFEPVSMNKDGSCTVPLTEGRNIVKLERSGNAEYQVITAKHVNVTVNDGKTVEPGDTISIVFDTLYHPCNKLAGVYNMNAVAVYTQVDAYEGQMVGGAGNQYTFASNAAAQTINGIVTQGTGSFGMVTFNKSGTITIPADYTGSTFTLDGGYLIAYGYGDPYGNHRGITLEDGKAPNMNASVKIGYMGVLPRIEIPVRQPIHATVSVLGDDLHNSEEDGVVHTLHDGNLQTWIQPTQLTLGKDDTARIAIETLLTNSGYTFVNQSGNYISSVTTPDGLSLGETDNGPNSGWMYTLNGKFPDLGINEQKLSDGDVIVFFYSDDYLKEDSNMGGDDPPTPPTPPAPSEDSGTTEPLPFVDVPKDAFFADAVAWAVKAGVTTGVDETHFAPDLPCDRAHAVTFLWRAAGSPEPVGKSNPFTDVASDAYYYKAVLWAVENGVTKGTSETTFSPTDLVTRAQAVTFLYRYGKGSGTARNPFTDVPADAYYVDAVNWAVEQSITTGTSDTTFSPDDSCIRSQIVTFLFRFFSKN